jgi:hypothetical protein
MVFNPVLQSVSFEWRIEIISIKDYIGSYEVVYCYFVVYVAFNYFLLWFSYVLICETFLCFIFIVVFFCVLCCVCSAALVAMFSLNFVYCGKVLFLPQFC